MLEQPGYSCYWLAGRKEFQSVMGSALHVLDAQGIASRKVLGGELRQSTENKLRKTFRTEFRTEFPCMSFVQWLPPKAMQLLRPGHPSKK